MLDRIIKHARQKLGLSAIEFALLINSEKPKNIVINHKQVANWEHKRTQCPTDKFIKMLRIINRELKNIGEKPVQF